jgi:hypothetical protein
MKAISFLLAAGLCGPAFGQNSVIAQGFVTTGAFKFYWQTQLEPPSPPFANPPGYASGINPRNQAIYRVMIDREQKAYFGYQVQVQPQGNGFHLSFLPLDLGEETLKQMHIEIPGSWNHLVLRAPSVHSVSSSGPLPDVVGVSDVIAVDLMVNPATGQKMVDYVTLQAANTQWTSGFFRNPVTREFTYAPGTPRDFTVADAGLRLVEPIVSIDGKPEPPTAVGEVRGAALWIYVPNYGRFVLSLVPRPDLGFRKLGEVRGTSLTITEGSHQIALTCAQPITTTSAAFNLYGLREAAWKPTYPNADTATFTMGGAERAESLLKP